MRAKVLLITPALLLDFFVVPLFLNFFILPSFLILTSFYLIFSGGKSILNQVPMYIPLILIGDILSPYTFGMVSISFLSSILLMSLIIFFVNFDKNIRGALFFTLISGIIYYPLLLGIAMRIVA
jgi:hypothetical protein